MLTSPRFFSKKNSGFSPLRSFVAVLRAGSRFMRHCAEPLSRSAFSPSSAAGRKTAAAKFSTGFSPLRNFVAAPRAVFRFANRLVVHSHNARRPFSFAAGQKKTAAKFSTGFSPLRNFVAAPRAVFRFANRLVVHSHNARRPFSFAAGQKKTAAKFSTGFSLVELLVVIGIVTVISATVLVRYGRFSGDVILGSLTYDVALSIRQAQVFGLSFRETGAGTGIFSGGYGIHFDKNTPNDYFLFADVDMNKRYSAPGDTIIENFSVRQGFAVFSLCATLPSGTEKCNPTISSLDISFQRPNPDALIYSDLSADTYKSARVVIRAPEGQTRSVSVVSTGQISVPQQ